MTCGVNGFSFGIDTDALPTVRNLNFLRQTTANNLRFWIYGQYAMGLSGTVLCESQIALLSLIDGFDKTQGFVEYCKK